MDRAEVARILGVAPGVITNYLTMSKPGGKYAKHPFPAPDGRIGTRAPYWLRERVQEIVMWDETRPRGPGGRPRAS
jgi:hypothetical protein